MVACPLRFTKNCDRGGLIHPYISISSPTSSPFSVQIDFEFPSFFVQEFGKDEWTSKKKCTESIIKFTSFWSYKNSYLL